MYYLLFVLSVKENDDFLWLEEVDWRRSHNLGWQFGCCNVSILLLVKSNVGDWQIGDCEHRAARRHIASLKL